jgi:hypothetical protein
MPYILRDRAETKKTYGSYTLKPAFSEQILDKLASKQPLDEADLAKIPNKIQQTSRRPLNNVYVDQYSIIISEMIKIMLESTNIINLRFSRLNAIDSAGASIDKVFYLCADLPSLDAIDNGRSSFEVISSDGVTFKAYDHYVLRSDVINGNHIWVNQGIGGIIFISDVLKKAIETEPSVSFTQCD